MKIIFSRKGFDWKFGGAPSPIVDGVPISLPIPDKVNSCTTYADIGLGDLVARVTRKCRPDDWCHEDPSFSDGRWALGQSHHAQSHLRKQGVDVGDVFLFYGLFRELGGGVPHHRLFGYMRIEEVLFPGAAPEPMTLPGFERAHPHTLGNWQPNNAIYVGTGSKSRTAHERLKLSKNDQHRVSTWLVPPWLRETGLSYHTNESRWAVDGELKTTSPGQEFVADIAGRADAEAWLADVIDHIER